MHEQLKINASQSAREFLGYLHDLPDKYQNSQKRFADLRKKSWEKPSDVHRFDRILSRPESSSWKSIRTLIILANHCEVAGEFSADMSQAFDKTIRNTLSNGQDSDLVRIGSSVLAKYLARMVSAATFGLPKLVGAGLYGLSGLLSISALMLSQLEKPEDYPEVKRSKKLFVEHTPVSRMENKIQDEKGRMLEKVYRWAERTPSPYLRGPIKAISRHLHRRKLGDPTLISRTSDAGYMFKHMHQYRGRTLLLLKLSKLSFNVASKLLTSLDKYAAHILCSKILAKFTGKLLGMRMAHMLTCTLAFLFSLFAKPAVLIIIQIGMIAALIAAVLLIAAKMDVLLFGSWRGDLAPPPKEPSLTQAV